MIKPIKKVPPLSYWLMRRIIENKIRFRHDKVLGIAFNSQIEHWEN